MNDEAYSIVMEHKQEYSENLIIIDAEFQMQSDDHINSSSNNHSSRAIYQIRPGAINFLRALNDFFDFFVFSRMPVDHIREIVDHFEAVLNEPVLESIRKYAENKKARNKKFLRIKKLPKEQNYFNLILTMKQYVYIEQQSKWVENLSLLLEGRPKEHIIFISSNSFSIISALNCQFSVIPVVHFHGLSNNDY